MQLRTCRLLVLLSTVVAFPIPVIPESRQEVSSDAVDAVIRQLWSANETESQTAKNELQRLGPLTIKPLVAILEDFVWAPYSTYGHRQENLRTRYLESNIATPGASNKRTKDDIHQITEVILRVRRDITDLLGALHAEEAAPVLIRLMRSNIEIAGREIEYYEMRALVEIGSASVPALIDSIQTAEAEANSTEPSGYLSVQQDKAAVNQIRYLIQKRAIILLGKIADKRALQILRTLQTEGTDAELMPYIEKALERIESSQ